MLLWRPLMFLDGSNISNALDCSGTVKNDKKMFENLIISVIHKIFSYFVWKNNTNVLLPAKKSVRIPVVFNQIFTYSSILETYLIVFDNSEHKIPIQVQCYGPNLWM